MNSDPNRTGRQRPDTTVAIFAATVTAVFIAAFAVTVHSVDTRQTNSDPPAGTIGLAHPHPPLDRGPGDPVK